MIRIILGEKGSGKTKKLLDLANDTCRDASGAVVFIDKGNRHVRQINHEVRLIDTEEFAINSAAAFYGLICGIISQNYDISHIFVDSVTKAAGEDLEAIGQSLAGLDELLERLDIELTATISVSYDKAPDSIKRFQV